MIASRFSFLINTRPLPYSKIMQIHFLFISSEIEIINKLNTILHKPSLVLTDIFTNFFTSLTACKLKYDILHFVYPIIVFLRNRHKITKLS